jgi:hypothetical protein
MHGGRCCRTYRSVKQKENCPNRTHRPQSSPRHPTLWSSLCPLHSLPAANFWPPPPMHPHCRREDLPSPASPAAASFVPTHFTAAGLPQARDDQPLPCLPAAAALSSRRRHTHVLCFATFVDSGHWRYRGGTGNPAESRRRQARHAHGRQERNPKYSICLCWIF